jgi:hypothetical protein
MASDKKPTKTTPAPEKPAAAKKDSSAGKDAAKAKTTETATETTTETTADTAAAAPANYSRGEGQKPVTTAYRENWNAIFGDKSTKRAKRTKRKKR